MKASVIVCTYNRSDLLPGVVESLQRQDFAGSWELIIVDNNSTDGTREVISGLAGQENQKKVPLRYVFEAKQGLSNARNAGIEAAKGEIIAFIDDDCLVEPQWLSRMVEIYDEQPDVGCAGGKIELIWPHAKPDWLPPDMEVSFGRLDLGEQVTGLEYPFGCNMSFRRSVFDSAGMFLTKLGRVSEALLSNEELEISSRLHKAGWKIKYVPGALAYHKVDKARLKKSWFYHRQYWQGRSDAVLDLELKKSPYLRLKNDWRRTADHGDGFASMCDRKNAKGYIQHVLGIDARDHGKIRALETVTFSIEKGFRDKLDAAIMELNSLKSEKARLESEKARLESEKARLESEKARLESEKARLESEKEDLNGVIRTLVNSTSWRITAPLRKTTNIIRRLKNGG